MPLEHIHPMVVHFPIALAFLALAFDLWWFVRRSAAASPLIQLRTGTVVLTLGALAAIVAYMFGDMAYDIAIAHGAPRDPLEMHEHWGKATLAVYVVAALIRLFFWWRQSDDKPAAIAVAIGLSAVITVMVVVTAYFGGHLVYDLGISVTPPH